MLALAGCVTRGTHREVVEERDRLAGERSRLAERVTLLEASNESLSQERVELIGQVEDLRQAKSALEENIEQLESLKQELSTSLETREAELADLRQMRETYDGLVGDLEAEVAAGRIQIERLKEGLRVNLSQEVLFPLGSAELGPGGEAVLRKVAARLRELPHRVEVQGHTDDLPIGGALAQRFPSNWELGGARAARVVRLLESAGVAPERLEAVSFADTRPVTSNATSDGRARNRRIEIRLIPVDATPVEPVAPAPSGAAAPAS